MNGIYKAKAVYQNGAFSTIPLSVNDGIIVSENEACGTVSDFSEYYIFSRFRRCTCSFA